MLRRPTRLSAFVNGRSPTVCAHPDCGNTFDGAAYKGRSGLLYCSRACRADYNDELSDENRARLVN